MSVQSRHSVLIVSITRSACALVFGARKGVRITPWGSQTPIPARARRYHQPMWSLLYLVVRALVRLVVGAGQHGRADGSKDLEILVLRHQLRVLQRTAGPVG